MNTTVMRNFVSRNVKNGGRLVAIHVNNKIVLKMYIRKIR